MRLRDSGFWGYAWKQVRFSAANIPSIPVGLFLLWLFTSEFGVYYLYSSVLSFCCTTVMNFWMNRLFRVIR